MILIAIRSAAVALGAATIAVGLGSILALATFQRRRLLSRLQIGLVCSFLLMPTYVMAGAWSAGFGSMGWWTLSQVTAARAPLVGIASVIWIHAIAATPASFMLLAIGLRHCSTAMIELSKFDGGLGIQLVRGIWPQWSTWCIGSFFLVAAWVSQDMVVTNLFQVVTLTEQCYLDQIADTASWSRRIAACSLSLGLGVVGMIVLYRSWQRDQRQRYVGSFNASSIGSDNWGVLVGSLIAALVVAIPLANLIIKAGWMAVESAPGTIRRAWNGQVALENLARVPWEYAEEWGWSLSLAPWSATLAIVAAVLGSLLPFPVSQAMYRRRFSTLTRSSNWLTVFFFSILFACFALPGPIVSGLVMDLFELPFKGLAWLRDHTLIAPILCLQFRLIPIAFFAMAVLKRRWQDQVGDLWAIDLDKSWVARVKAYWLAMYRSLLAIWGILFAIAFGDLSTYLPCLPPGVTPVSMRIFDLLHYGVRSSEAGLLLFLATTGAAFGAVVLTILSNRR